MGLSFHIKSGFRYTEVFFKVSRNTFNSPYHSVKITLIGNFWPQDM
ncbi:332_t:CDS:1, partial [Dentiscutata erythropus]